MRKIMVKTVEEVMAGVHDEAERLLPLGRQDVFRCTLRKRRGGGMGSQGSTSDGPRV